MKVTKLALLACSALAAAPMHAFAADDQAGRRTDIVVTAAKETSKAGTKTDTPLIETPQPISVVTDDLYLAQGAVSVADTLRYVSGVQPNSYGPDSRVDSSFIRGVDPLQFRDGMRDIFSYYASIRSDPYNFSQVEVVRGPASVLFGSGSIGGLINLVSKTPQFKAGGEVSVRYGSFDNKEALADLTSPLTDNLAGRIVAKVRDANTQTDYVKDDRVLFAPSLLWRATENTDVTVIGLYQDDHGGSTAQFLPLFGTLYANPNGKLDNSLFIGKPGWDRYDGTLFQGTALVEHRFSDQLKLNLKARAIDSDLTYLTHYPDNYSNPLNPFLDADQRIMGLYSDGSYARLNILSTDNNVQYDFSTGENIKHKLLAGVDYSWNRVQKTSGFGYEFIDIYDVDYSSLSDYSGGLPPTFGISTTDVRQEQLGFYIQDQIRLYDRASIVLGARRDDVTTEAVGSADEEADATSLRAGLIYEIVKGVSPFVSYTESFEPISGINSTGSPFKPKEGKQYEAGVKFHPDDVTLVTLTAYNIEESNRPVDDPSTSDPFDQTQAGGMTSKGFEIEASRLLPGDYEIIANYSYVDAQIDGTNQQLENVPKHNASIWATKTIALPQEASLRLGGGVRYSSANYSYGPSFPDGVKTPSYVLVDALAQLSWKKWLFSLNATNLFDKEYYSACLARGDCFNGAERNIYGTLTYRY